MDGLVRYAMRSTVRLATARPQGKIIVEPGEIEVRLSSGGTATLQFERTFRLDPSYAHEAEDDLKLIMAVMWPERARGRVVHAMRDGLSLCDMAAVVRDEIYAIGLLEYGLQRGWWRAVYDEHIVCQHAHERKCFTHCTLTIDQFSPPPRRPKKEKQKERATIGSKFRLPDLFPERGIAIA